MRNFVISDVHGNNKAFRKALKSVHLKKDDRIYLLGDVIDRGKDSKEVLDTIILLKENDFDVTCIKGNHEEMFLEAFESNDNYNLWLKNGGDKTLESFLTSSIENIPLKYKQLIQSFVNYFEVGEYILVHAALNMKITDPYSDLKTLLWERDASKFFDPTWLKDRIMIHGHTPISRSEIENSIINHHKIINIDNGSFLKRDDYGSLCILQLENLNINFIK